MRKYAIIAFILVTLILSYFYFRLGGGSEVRTTIESVEDYYIIGQSFKGKYNSRDLESIFFQAKSLGDEVVIINYSLGEDSTKNGFIHQYIGAKRSTLPADLPEGFQLEYMKSSQVVRAAIDVHNLIMPKPKEIEEALRTYAKEQNRTLRSYTIERYRSERELIVEIPMIQ